MGQRRDINKIYCYIDFSQETNYSLFSRWEIHSLISKDVSNYLKQYKLEYEITPLGGMGGGRVETLWEIIKFAWNNKDIIAIFLASIKTILNIPKYIKSTLNSLSSPIGPVINICLELRTNTNFTDKNLNIAFSQRLINLRLINDSICKELSNKYPIFRFNERLGLFSYPRKFGVNYELNADQKNTFNNFRLIRLIQGLKIKDNRYIRYCFSKWLLISRFDEILNIEGKTRMRTPYKRYYLLLSTHIISDYY